MLYIQLIGVLAFCIWVLCYYRKEIKEILVFQSVSQSLYFIHYLLLGALSGAYLSIIGIARNISFILLKKNKKMLVFIFILLYLMVSVLFYEGLYSLIPMCALSIYMLFMLKNNKLSLLEGEFICALLWLIYNIFVHSYSGVVGEAILCVSCVYQIIKIKSTKN